jgi:hypothetical protein
MHKLIPVHLSIAALVALPTAASAVEIDVSSQSYTVQGGFGVPWFSSGAFSISDSSPVSSPGGAMVANGSVNPAAGTLSAGASVDYNTFVGVYGTGTAQITWRPSENCLADISAFRDFANASDSYSDWTLKDLTTSTTIFSAQFSGGPTTSGQNNVPLDASDTYQLTTYVWSQNTGGGAEASGTITLYSAPDTAGTTLLLGLALAGLAGFRRALVAPGEKAS